MSTAQLRAMGLNQIISVMKKLGLRTQDIEDKGQALTALLRSASGLN